MRLILVALLAVAGFILVLGSWPLRVGDSANDSALTGEGASTPEPTTEPAPPAADLTGSEGCGTAVAAGASVLSLESSGIDRTYRLYVPERYDPNMPTPLVLNFHGLGASAQQQERYSGYPEVADQYGFIIVSPQGSSRPSEWFLYGDVEPGYVDDFAFIDSLIDEISASLCIDPTRVYATGISNGGGMTSLVGCVLSERIAAIAPVAGSPYSEPACRDAGPVPIVTFHGTGDQLVPFDEQPDEGRLDLFRHGARNNVRAWAQHNGCDLTLQTQRIADDVVLESYGGCADGADVHLYVIEGGGHTWPGASDLSGDGYTTLSISATELSWLFFAAHPKP